jgi:hypothetical protein
MDACDVYKPWHDKHTHRTFLRPDTGKCLHYYFYFIDAELGPDLSARAALRSAVSKPSVNRS